jgi:hypothetical protein
VVKKSVGQFEGLVEQRIRTAMVDGVFDGLPGKGRPLVLDDDSLVPEDMRLAHRVLKNAAYLPEELELRREIAGIHGTLKQALDGEARACADKRLALLRTRLAARGGERPAHLENAYLNRIRRRLAGDP